MTGKLKNGDFKRSIVNKSFKILIKSKYKNNKNIFYSDLITYARYAGPIYYFMQLLEKILVALIF